MRWHFAQGSAIVSPNSRRYIKLFNFTVRIHSDQNICHVCLKYKKDQISQVPTNSKDIDSTYIDFITVIAGLEIVQKSSLVKYHKFTCKC